jgi:hypothetical protein
MEARKRSFPLAVNTVSHKRQYVTSYEEPPIGRGSSSHPGLWSPRG